MGLLSVNSRSAKYRYVGGRVEDKDHASNLAQHYGIGLMDLSLESPRIRQAWKQNRGYVMV